MSISPFENIFRSIPGMVLAVILVLVPFHGMCAERSGEEPPFTPVIGYSSSIFTHLVKENSQIAATLWSNLVIRKKNGTADTMIFYSHQQLKHELQAGKIDLVILLASEYLEFEDRSLIDPLFISVRGKDIYDNLILLVRSDSGIRSVRDLQGKKLSLLKGASCEPHNIWLEMLMMKQGVREPRKYFSSINEVLSPSQTLMPVFFKQADACILSRHSYDVIAELNPQLRSELRVIEESVPLATGVIAVRKGYDSRHQAKLREILEALDNDVQGRQLLTLFRMSRLVPFRPKYLASTEGFLKEYAILKSKMAKRRR